MRYRVPPRLAHVTADHCGHELPIVHLRQLPDGEPLILKGAGGVIWTIAAEGRDDVAAAVAAAFGCPVETIGDTVSDFLTDLVHRGLLELDSAQREQE